MYIVHWTLTSAVDPDPDPWIRAFLAGSGSAYFRIQMRIQLYDSLNGFLAKFEGI